MKTDATPQPLPPCRACGKEPKVLPPRLCWGIMRRVDWLVGCMNRKCPNWKRNPGVGGFTREEAEAKWREENE